MSIALPGVITTTLGPADSFAADARHALAGMRRACARALSACGGMERAVDVSSRLGLDRSLAWKIWRIAQGADEVPSPAHIPGTAGFERFVEAVAARGVDPALVQAMREAFREYQAIASRYAGDRATAGMMFGTLTSEGRSRFEHAIRRDGFRAGVHFLGVQASTLFQIDVLMPRAGHFPDVARLRGHIGLQRIRDNVPWLIARSSYALASGLSSNLRRGPLLDASASAQQPPADPHSAAHSTLLPDFCSQPLPRTRRRVVAGVTVEDELLPGPVGHLHSVDVVAGELITHLELGDRPANQRGDHVDAVTMGVTTPAERLVYDVLAPRGTLERVALRVHSTVHTDVPYLREPEYAQIPVPEQVQHIGPADMAPPAPEIPRHADMLSWLFQRLGLQAADMELWRVRMRFPPVPSLACVSYVLPPAS